MLLIRGSAALSLRLTFLCCSVWADLLFIYLVSVFGLVGFSDFFIIVAFILGIIPVVNVSYGYKNAAIYCRP